MMESKWDEDTLKGIFRYLGRIRAEPANPVLNLARCKLVCKKWRDILTNDDFMGQCLCGGIWPSLSRSQSRDVTSLFTHIYRTFSYDSISVKFVPKSSIIDYKFYLDIWNGDDGSLILSKVIKPSSLSRDGSYSIPSPGISDPLVALHLESSDYKLIAPIEPRLTIQRPRSVKVSLLVGRKDVQTACVIHKSVTHAVLPQGSFAVAYNDVHFCLSTNVFVPHVRAWLCMYFLDDDVAGDTVDVFGIELGFSDVPLSKDELGPPAHRKYIHHGGGWPWEKIVVRPLDEDKFMCLLDSLDWKRYNQKINYRKSVAGEFERPSCEEVVNLVFSFLEGKDLAKCMLVSKQWRDIGEDEYFWKCLYAKGWPSLYKELLQPKLRNVKTYHQMFGRYWLKPPCYGWALDFPPHVFDISDVELYLDLQVGKLLVFSKVINGVDLLEGEIDVSAPDICHAIRTHLESLEFKLIIPIEPRFSVFLKNAIYINLLVRRRDINKVACLFGPFDIMGYNYERLYIESAPNKCLNYPFAPNFNVFFSLLSTSKGQANYTGQEEFDIFGAELDFFEFGHAFESKEQLLWILHMLEWK